MESTKERTHLQELKERVQVGFKERLEARIDAIVRQEQKSEADNSYKLGLRLLNDIYDILEDSKKQGEPVDMNAMLVSEDRKDRFLKYVYRNAAHFARSGDYDSALLAQNMTIYFSHLDNEEIRKAMESRASETIEQIARYVELEKSTSAFEADRLEKLDNQEEMIMLQRGMIKDIGAQLYLLGSPLYNLFMRGLSALKGKLEKTTSKYEQLKVIKAEEQSKEVPDLSDPQKRIKFIRESVCTDYPENPTFSSAQTLEASVQEERTGKAPEEVKQLMEQIRAQGPQEPEDYYKRTKRRLEQYLRANKRFAKNREAIAIYSEPMTQEEKIRAWNDALMIHPHSTPNELLRIVSENPKDNMIREQVAEILKRKCLPIEDLFAHMDSINPSDSGALGLLSLATLYVDSLKPVETAGEK